MKTLMKPIPFKLAKCPIEEAVFEIRFTSVFPPEAVFGIFYQLIGKYFPDTNLTKLPILQIPEAFRQSDPNLTYQAHYRMQKDNFVVSLGPRNLVFSILKPYTGWDGWQAFIQSIVKELTDNNVFSVVERTGLRYINFFDKELFSIANAKVILTENILTDQSTTLRTEIRDKEFLKILQLANNVAVQQDNRSFIGSIIDIDIVLNLNVDNYNFSQTIDSVLNSSHKKEKELFFNLLADEFIINLEPEYHEEEND